MAKKKRKKRTEAKAIKESIPMAGMGAIIGSLFNRKSALGGASLAGGVTLAGAKDSEPYG